MKSRVLRLAFLSVLVGLAFTTVPATAASAAGKNSPLPNIVVFISDDHGMLDSQAYGSTEVRTPHMARLAADGLKFTHAFVASPSCGPSRTARKTPMPWHTRPGSRGRGL